MMFWIMKNGWYVSFIVGLTCLVLISSKLPIDAGIFKFGVRLVLFSGSWIFILLAGVLGTAKSFKLNEGEWKLKGGRLWGL